jgi:hypothetical protein
MRYQYELNLIHSYYKGWIIGCIDDPKGTNEYYLLYKIKFVIFFYIK